MRREIHLPAVYDCVTMHLVMPDLELTQRVCWDLSIFLRALLLGLLFFRSNVRSFPFFSCYLLANFLQALIIHFTYSTWGFASPVSSWVAWGSEAPVICARALAVAELCRLLLIGYRGIWSLASRVLLSCATVVLFYSFLVSERGWDFAIIGANRALELAIAAVIVVLFVFLRHYDVATQPAPRALALGFCLYSCAAVLNDTVLQQRLATAYGSMWNLLGVLTFLASLFVWTWALRKSVPRPVLDPLLPDSVYRQLSPEINLRLRLLNERLGQFWRVEVPRP